MRTVAASSVALAPLARCRASLSIECILEAPWSGPISSNAAEKRTPVANFEIQARDRLRAGIIERLVAVKPG
jgi:hypothetical protein